MAWQHITWLAFAKRTNGHKLKLTDRDRWAITNLELLAGLPFINLSSYSLFCMDLCLGGSQNIPSTYNVLYAANC